MLSCQFWPTERQKIQIRTTFQFREQSQKKERCKTRGNESDRRVSPERVYGAKILSMEEGSLGTGEKSSSSRRVVVGYDKAKGLLGKGESS